ncbi:radical SAM protein, partial [Candidatus Nomurabacteria bacterium]|nr:radical SAM protein [Candidatus Nomurabacteria bacterium]
MNERQILEHLREEDSKDLFKEADRVRREYMGDAIHLRGLLEFSNMCGRDCLYCGLRCSNQHIDRYCMDPEEMFQSVKEACELGYKSFVLQSGESCRFPVDVLGQLITRIKDSFDVAITLSVGEKTYEEYALLKRSGADRYLLRFETSNKALFRSLKLDSSYEERMQCLRWLKELDYQVGSGIM